MLPLYRAEKILTNFNYNIRKVDTNYTQCVHGISLVPVTPQSCIDDLSINFFKNFQRDPSLGHYRGEPTFLDESFPCLLERPTIVDKTQNVTEDPTPVTVNILFPIAPAPVPFGLPAVPDPSVAPDTTNAEAPEPQVYEPPYLRTQDVRFSDSSDDSPTHVALLQA